MAEGLEIVGLGLATLDVLVRLGDMPTWDKGVPIRALALDGGGPVGTAMAAAARLGARVGFVGTCGNDLCGEIKLRSLAQAGVDLSHVAHRAEPENQVVLVCVDERNGERVFCGLDSFGQKPLRIDELDREYVISGRYLHLDGTHAEAALQAAHWMHDAGKPVMLDAARVTASTRVGLPSLIAHVDVLICGSGFGAALTGEHDLHTAARTMLSLGPSIVVQTEGANGSYTTTQREQFHTPAFAVDVVDTTGAGDVFHGAYLVGLLKGWELRRTATFASAVAAIKCTRLGGRAGIPGYDQVLEFLRARGSDIAG